MIINISGSEGAGKSQCAKAIAEVFSLTNKTFISTREPGSTPIAEEIRALVKDFKTEEEFHPLTELLLFYAARYQLFKNLIIPSIKQGEMVIADRSFACTFAYQLRAAKVIKESDFWTIHNLVMQDMPDYDLIFHLYTNTAEEGLIRARGRGALDRIEQKDISFFERAREGYFEFFKDKPNVIHINTSEKNEAEVKRFVQKIILHKMIENKIIDSDNLTSEISELL